MPQPAEIEARARACGFSIPDLCKTSGVPNSTFYRWRKGKGASFRSVERLVGTVEAAEEEQGAKEVERAPQDGRRRQSSDRRNRSSECRRQFATAQNAKRDIATILHQARTDIAELAGVRMEFVRLDLRISTAAN